MSAFNQTYPIMDTQASDIKQLFQMHQFMRPHGSQAAKVFCERYLDTLTGMRIDEVGNRILQIGEKPLVLWSSHYDTVHSKGGAQRLAYGDGMLCLSEKETEATCLGADCTAGVWLMVQMIENNIPGLYIFHAGEECGGIGSRHIADNTPEILKGIDYAIAFDRKGVDSVITNQWGRCCSDRFAQEFAKLIGNGFVPDDTGIFTDTANYTSLVPECTNISVGYYNAHSKDEWLNVEFLVWLRDRIITIAPEITKLPAVRDPSVSTFSHYSSYYLGKYGRTGYGLDEYVNDREPETLEDLVDAYPNLVAQMLEEMGWTYSDVQSYIATEIEKSL